MAGDAEDVDADACAAPRGVTRGVVDDDGGIPDAVKRGQARGPSGEQPARLAVRPQVAVCRTALAESGPLTVPLSAEGGGASGGSVELPTRCEALRMVQWTVDPPEERSFVSFVLSSPSSRFGIV